MVHFTRYLKNVLMIFVILCISLNCSLADDAAIDKCKAIMDAHFGSNVSPSPTFPTEFYGEKKYDLTVVETSTKTILMDLIMNYIFALDIAGNVHELIESYYHHLIKTAIDTAIIFQNINDICINFVLEKRVNDDEINVCKKELQEKFGNSSEQFKKAVYFNKLGDKNETLVKKKNGDPNINYYTHTPDSYGGLYLLNVAKNAVPADDSNPYRYCVWIDSQNSNVPTAK